MDTMFLFLLIISLLNCSTSVGVGNYTTTRGDIIVGRCTPSSQYLGLPRVLCSMPMNASAKQESLLSMIEALNLTNIICSAYGNDKYSRLEDLPMPYFASPAQLPSISFSRCLYPNESYARVLEDLNVDVSALSLLELRDLSPKPPLQASFFKNLNLTAVKIIYSDEARLTPRLPEDVTRYAARLRSFELVGAELPTLPADSKLETILLDGGRSRGHLGGCSHLQKLTLSSWEVQTSSSDGWLSSCENLTHLVLDSLASDTIYRVLTNAKSLRKLEVTRVPRNMWELEIGVTNAIRLTSLKIHKTAVFRVKLNQGFPLLADVDLSGNNLWSASNLKSFLLPACLLTNLTVSHNPELNLCHFTSSESETIWLPNLKRLVARHTATDGICFSYFDNHSLILLDLSYNNIIRLELDGLPRFNRSMLELRLNYNSIEKVTFEDGDYNRFLKDDIRSQPGIMGVRELHLRGNRIQNFTAVSLPDTLKFLDLSNNRISYITNETATALFSSKERRVKLAGNSFVCECKNQDFLLILDENKNQVDDYDSIICAEDNTPIRNVTLSTLCETPKHQRLSIIFRILLPILLVSVGIIILFVAVYFRFEHDIKIFLYARGLCLFWLREDDLDADRPFDVFVSFSHEDEKYVLGELVPGLEREGYRTCVHARDWVAGEWIPKQIAASIALSRRTLLVLSDGFFKSTWGMLEFRMAHGAALREGRARLVAVARTTPPSLPPSHPAHPDLAAFLATNTYLREDDPRFWDKLKFALPRRDLTTQKQSNTKSQTASKRSQNTQDLPEGFGPYAGLRPLVAIEERMAQSDFRL